MPMPTEGAWPPKVYADAYTRYGDWDAWYRGDPDVLRYRFAGRGAVGADTPASPRVRQSQYMGGVIGRASRWLWGTPPSANERDGRLHVPLPADLTTTAANLLFSEPPKLSAPVPPGAKPGKTGDARIDERLELLDADGFPTVMLHAAEANSFLGDVYLRPVIDEEVLPGRAFVATVHADGALPVIRWNRLVEVTFWHCLYVDGVEYLRMLEHHSVVDGAGRIEYAVFKGTIDQLGSRVTDLRVLKSHGFAELVTDELVENQGVQETGIDVLDVVRIPNAGPQRTWRTHPILKYYGRSDFDGNEQVFDQIDTVWTSWMRDVRLAKGRIILPDYMLNSNGPGGGATFDAEREVWMALSDLPNPTGGRSPITAQQFAIRAADHKATLDELVAVAMQHAGLSQQTLGHDDGATAMTATEAQARERLSFTTRDTRIQPYTVGIADIVELLLKIEAEHFSGPEPVKPHVEFGDGVTESPEAVAQVVQLLTAAEAISTETKVRMVHPDWKQEQVDAEVQKIKDQAQAALPPPGDSFGDGPPDGPPNPGKGKPTG